MQIVTQCLLFSSGPDNLSVLNGLLRDDGCLCMLEASTGEEEEEILYREGSKHHLFTVDAAGLNLLTCDAAAEDCRPREEE